jgi:hypothetical protein
MSAFQELGLELPQINTSSFIRRTGSVDMRMTEVAGRRRW